MLARAPKTALITAITGQDGSYLAELLLDKCVGEGSWQCARDVLEAARGADALLLLTEWEQFVGIGWLVAAAVMRRPAWLFDAHTKADAAAARAAGLQVWRVGEG